MSSDAPVYVLGLSAYAVGSLLVAAPGTPVVVAVAVGLVFGAVLGLVNGALVRFGNVPALVVTLGTLYVYRGLAFFWAGGQQINADELPLNGLTAGSRLYAKVACINSASTLDNLVLLEAKPRYVE